MCFQILAILGTQLWQDTTLTNACCRRFNMHHPYCRRFNRACEPCETCQSLNQLVRCSITHLCFCRALFRDFVIDQQTFTWFQLFCYKFICLTVHTWTPLLNSKLSLSPWVPHCRSRCVFWVICPSLHSFSYTCVIQVSIFFMLNASERRLLRMEVSELTASSNQSAGVLLETLNPT